MGDKCNCYRFSPRDSLSGAVAQIADYLSKHPGWNETELRAFVDGLISSAGVETFNGRSGNITLNKDDVNNLLIANCYFAEADETIESIDVLALYKLGIRIVFTQYSSEIDGYTLAYGIEYYPGTDTAKAYLFSSGSGGGTGAIVSVNGKTGVVVLKASDILMNNGDSVEDAVSNAKTIANAAYSPDNPPPYPVTSVNGKTGTVTGLYDKNNPPPYPVTSVNGKTGTVTGLYDKNNPPPYPVNSVNSKTGSVTLKVVDVSNGNSTDENAYMFIDESDDYPDVIASDSSKLGGKVPEYYLQAFNLLDNSDFTNLVAQAGVGGNHGTVAYAADRWILDSGTVSYEAGVGLTLNGTIRQKLEFQPTGQTSTFVGMVTGDASISYAGGVVTITSSGGVLKWAALYLGSYTSETMPPYVPKGYIVELLSCMYYYQELVATNTYSALGWAIAYSSNTLKTLIYLKAPMREDVNPTITYYGTWEAYQTGITRLITNFTNDQIGCGTIRLHTVIDGEVTVNSFYMIRAKNNKGSKICISMDL